MKSINFLRNYDFLILPFLSAILVVISFPKINIDFLIFLSLVPFFLSISRDSKIKTLISGFVTGFFISLLGFLWIMDVIINFSDVHPILAAIACILYAIYSSIMFILYAFIFRYLQNFPRFHLFILLPAIYTILEFFFPCIFPWNLGASIYRRIELIQIADVAGISGITFLILIINAFLYLSIKEKKVLIKEGIVTLFLVILAIGYGHFRINEQQIIASDRVKFLIVQPNVSNEEKDIAFRNADVSMKLMAKMERLSITNEKPDIVLWPETALPFLLEYPSHKFFKDRLTAFSMQNGFDMIVGAIGFDGKNEYNSSFLISRDGKILDRYDKIKLLMFGEYIPFSDRFPFLLKLYSGSGNFGKGNKYIPFMYDNVEIITPICYELVIPGLIRKLMAPVSNGIIVNLTNDSWFGDTQEPHQHLALSVFRAVEHHVPIVRATNTGISAVIDRNGKILKKSALFREDSIYAEVESGHQNTFYKKHGELFLFTLIVTVVFMLIKNRKKQNSSVKNKRVRKV